MIQCKLGVRFGRWNHTRGLEVVEADMEYNLAMLSGEMCSCVIHEAEDSVAEHVNGLAVCRCKAYE